jgi:iron complex outermembrane receptor protein
MRSRICVAAICTLPLAAQAADTTNAMPPVVVTATRPDQPGGDILARKLTAVDTADLLQQYPGMSLYSAGGVSALPAIHGLADDRIKIRVDGMDITSACANHMNPPLSYIHPAQIGSIDVMAGITPVSAGGDSIAGTIAVKSPAPVFAMPGEAVHTSGSLTLSGRTVNDSFSTAVSTAIANEHVSLGYSGAIAQGESYYDGRGKKVLDTQYKTTDQSVTLGIKGADSLLVARVGEQWIPYQGYPNQYMDMVGNHGRFADIGYTGQFDWGKLDATFYWHDTRHKMGFFTSEKPGTMPMRTHGRDIGYTLKAELPLAQRHTLRLGNEYHRFRLDDYWPAVPGNMMMGPNTFVNINDGQRDRLAFFAEAESRWTSKWTTLIGLRDEIVQTDTGAVQPYNPMPKIGMGMMAMTNLDPAAAAAFNALDRAREDNNIDVTALARYTPDAAQTYEFGYARKSRTPNLYERYAWGRNVMDMTMVGWYGDANGYVGNPDLKPEVAHTVSVSGTWRDANRQKWEIKLTPYFTYVENFVDADVIGSYHPFSVMSETRALLRFANHDARLYGVDVAGRLALWDNARFGYGEFRGSLSWTHGERTDGGDLYHIMPLHALLDLEQTWRGWTHTLELDLVDEKTEVDARRFEAKTSAYALVNLRTRYRVSKHATVSAGISNLFDEYYALPLGGANLAAFKAAGSGQIGTIPGEGRSLNVGLNVSF